MKPRLWFAVVTIVAAGVGAAACAGDEDLNPQPLPPGGEDGKNSSSGGSGATIPGSSGTSGSSSGLSGSTSSSSGAPPYEDAGADDAGDAGADANDGAPQ